MMKLSIRDKVILIILAAVILGFCEYKFICSHLNSVIAEKRIEKDNAKSLLTDITPLVKESEKLEEKEAELRKKADRIRNEADGATATNEEFLVYLGNSVARHNVSVIAFNHLGTSEENGIYKMILDFELKGNGNNINSVLSDIDIIGIKYSIGSFSYRQNEQYNYLKRFYDEFTDLPWYKELEETEENTDVFEEIPPYEDNNFFNDEPFYSDNNNDYDIPYSPEPEIVVPKKEELPQETEPPEDTPKSIDERLNELLELMGYMNTGYKVTYLDNKENFIYTEGQEMRIAVTVCLSMFKEPVPRDGILKGTGAFIDGVF